MDEPVLSPKRQQSAVYSSRLFSIPNPVSNATDVMYKIILLETKNGDFLGEEQWHWLERELADTAELDFVLLGSPIQFLPAKVCPGTSNFDNK
jgi:phosphodiesterase/alkaline phosphatase D-like protein